MRLRALRIFIGITMLTVALSVTVVQSAVFANALKQIIVKFVPNNIGVGLDFKDLNVLFFPPGIVVNKPVVTFENKNALNLPETSKLEFNKIEVTFQFFQLMTGAININAFTIHGADLVLFLDREFIENLTKNKNEKKKSKNNIWDQLVEYNFRSIGLVDSKIDISFESLIAGQPARIKGSAKEFTISRGTRDKEISYDLSLDISEGILQSKSYEHKLASLRASIEVFEKGALIRSISLQEGEVILHCNGTIKGNITDPKNLPADLDLLIMGPITQIISKQGLGAHIEIPLKETLSGKIKLETHISGDLLNFKNTYDINANAEVKDFTYDKWVLTEAKIKSKITPDLIKVDHVDINFLNGKLRATGAEFDTDEPPYLRKATIDVENADIRQVLGSFVKHVYPLSMMLSGQVVVTNDGSKPIAVKVVPKLEATGLVLDNQSPVVKRTRKIILETSKAKLPEGELFVNEKGILFNSVHVNFTDSKLALNGRFDFKKGFNLDILGHVDLADFKHIAGAQIAGNGKLHWTVQGPSNDVVLAFDHDLNKAEFLDMNLGSLKGRVVLYDERDYLGLENLHVKSGNMEIAGSGGINLKTNVDEIDLKANITKGSISDFNILMANYLKPLDWYPYDLNADISGQLAIFGKLDPSKLSIISDLKLRNIEYKNEIINEGTMRTGYKHGLFFADDIALRKKSGRITGSVNFDQYSKIFSADLVTESMNLGDLDHIGNLGIPYSAPLNAKAKLKGQFGALEGIATIALGYGTIKSITVPPSEVIIQALNRRYNVTGNIFAGQALVRAEWGQEKNTQGQLSIDSESLDFSPLLATINPSLLDDPLFLAKIKGSVSLRFMTNQLSKSTGRVSLAQFNLRKKGSKLQLVNPLDLSINAGDYAFNKLRLLGDGTELTITGRVKSGEIDYDILGELPLSLVEFFTPAIPVFKGVTALSAKLSGRADAPDLYCTGRILSADLRIAKIEQLLEGITGEYTAKGNGVSFTNLSARFGGGTVTGSGLAQIYLTQSPSLDFSFNLRNPKFKVYPFSYIRMNGDLSVRGDSMPYLVSGKVDIAEALIQQNFSSSDGKAARSSIFFPKSATGSSNDLHLFDMDLSVVADKDVFVKNDIIDAELKGRLKLLGSIEAVRPLGTLEVLQGKLLFNDNAFTIQTGIVNFNNPAMIDPEFDMTASIDQKGYKINLYASGKPSDPRISFRSQPPLAQQEIVTLLALGMTSSGFQSLRSQDRDAYSRDEVYSLLFNQSGVSKGLKNKLGLNVGVDQAVNTNIAESAFRRNADQNLNVAPKVVLQKEVVKNLNAKVGSTIGVGDSRQQDLNLEYQFGKNTSVTGVYEDQRGSTPRNSRTSMGVDLKFRWNFK